MAHRFMVMKKHVWVIENSGLLVTCVSLVLTLVTLLYVPTAHAQAEEVPAHAQAEEVQTGPDIEPKVITAAARVGAVQQNTVGDLTLFVRLHQPTSPFPQIFCPGRSDGWFILPNSSKQLNALEVVLLAFDRGFRVRVDYNPSTCVAGSVSACALGPC